MTGNILLVFCGGGIGSVLRYGMQGLMGKPDGHAFPLATLSANLLGCFLIGLMAAAALKFKWSETAVLFVFTGVLGGFTTFSSFSLDFFSLMKNNHTAMAFVYLGLSNLAGIGLCVLGFFCIK